MLDKRIKRLYTKIDSAKKILVILSTSFTFDEKLMYKIKDTFEVLYPDKKFVFCTIMLKANEFSQKDVENMRFIYSKRSDNLYDYNNTNFEWAFLDKVRLSKKPFVKIHFSFKFIKRRINFTLSWERDI